MCAKIQIYKYGLRYNELKYRGKKKVLNHVIIYKEILHIRTVKQRQKKYIYEIKKTLNLYFSLLESFCPRPHDCLLPDEGKFTVP